jgi:hypothetical protein
MADTEYAKAIQTKATVANLEMNAAPADIAELSDRESKQKAAY